MAFEKHESQWGYLLVDGDIRLATVVKTPKFLDRVNFVTSQDDFMQFAIMNRPTEEKIVAHRHLSRERKVSQTQEVLIILEGRLRVDFYDTTDTYLVSDALSAGNAVILHAGGHGFEVLEDCKLYEVKQGPFSPSVDKVPIRAVRSADVKWIAN